MENFKPQNQVSLLFFDNIDHQQSRSLNKGDQSQGNRKVCDEIEFTQPVRVNLIRIVKPNSEVHQLLKPLKTVTDKEGQFKNLEIFFKDLSIPNDKYCMLINAKTITESKNLNHDVLIPVPQGIYTNQLVFRGEYTKLTVCVYGDVLQEQEIADLCPLYNKTFDLDLLPQKKTFDEEQERKNKIIGDNENIKIQRLENAQKIIQNIFQKNNYHISYEQIQPNILIEKQDPKDKEILTQHIYELVGEINRLTAQNEEELKQSLHIYRQKLQQLAGHLQTLLKLNEEQLHDPAHFEGQVSIHRDIPPSVVQICLQTLNDSPSDYIRGLDLALQLISSYDHAIEFIENEGLTKIYKILRYNEEDNHHFVFSSMKMKALEVINAAITYKQGAYSFLNYCIREFQKQREGSQQIEDDQDIPTSSRLDLDRETSTREREDRSEKSDRQKDKKDDKKEKREGSESKSRSRSRKKDKKKKEKKSHKSEKKDKDAKKRSKSSRSKEKEKDKRKSKKSKRSDRRHSKSSSKSKSESRSNSYKRYQDDSTTNASVNSKRYNDKRDKSGNQSSSKNQSSSNYKENFKDQNNYSSTNLSQNNNDNNNQDEKENDVQLCLEKGYQIILYEITKHTQNDQILRACKQILHKSLMCFYLDKIEKTVQDDLINCSYAGSGLAINESMNMELNQDNDEQEDQETIERKKKQVKYNTFILNLNKVGLDIQFYLTKLLAIIKEQTLVNGQLSSGSTFEDIMNKNFMSEKKRQIQKFSSLKEVIKSDLHTLNNENIRFISQMKLFPSLLIILTSPHLKESKEFGKIFINCYNIIAHLLSCRGSILIFSKNKEVLKTLIQVLDQLQNPLKDFQQKFQIDNYYLNEFNFSSHFSDRMSFDQCIMNNDSFLTQNRDKLSDQQYESILIALLSKQLSYIMKYFVQLVNTINQIYVKMLATENDLEMVQLLSDISTISSKSNVSQIALNKFLLNNFVMDAVFNLFNVSEAEHLIQRQVEVSIICVILYNALVFDNGVLTILYANQIFLNLIKINKFLGDNQSEFESNRELRIYANLLINYMFPLEIFMDEAKRGFQGLANELKKKSFYTEDDEKNINIKSQIEKHYNIEKQVSIKEFRENFLKYGNLDEPDQNLIFIDVSLKIFNLLITYNKNVFINYYDSGLMSNFDHLAKNLTSLTSFFTIKSIGPENLFRKYHYKPRIINQYSSVLKKLIHIFVQRFQYKGGFQPKEKSTSLQSKPSNLLLPGQHGGLHSAPIPPPLPNSQNQSGFNQNLNQNQAQNSEKDYLFKYDQFYIEQIEMMMQLYTTGYQLIQNSFELNCVYLDKSNWQIIFSNILNFYKLIFDCTQLENSNANTSQNSQSSQGNNQNLGQGGNNSNNSSSNSSSNNNLSKFIQRIEKAFYSFQQQMVNKIEDRPALLNLLTSIIALSKFNGSQDYILTAIIDNFQFEKLLELQLENRETLLDTILNNYINLHSKLIKKETEFFFRVVLNFYHYPTTFRICEKFTEMIMKHYSGLKEIVQKGDKKEISGFEYRKENDQIIENMRNLQKICQYLFLCCSNSGFSNIFLYNHVDNELIKILHTTTQLEEQSRAKTNKDVQYALYALKNDCLKVFTVLMDHEIGLSSLNPKHNYSKNYQYLVEDIPQISHQQEFFELVGRQNLEIPQQLLDKILKNSFMKGDEQQMDEEQNEEPDFNQDEEEDENHIQKSLLTSDPNMQTNLIQYVQNIIDILQVSSKNLVGQLIILYKDYIGYAYKSNPSLKLTNLTLQFMRNILPAKGFAISNFVLQLIKIFESYLFFISELTIHPLTQQFFYSEKRKNAIKTLIIDETILSEFNFEVDQNCQKQNENGRILEQIFTLFEIQISGFMQELFEQSQFEHNQNDEAIDLLNQLMEQCERCKVILGYLKNYSSTVEEKSKSSHEKNPDLPTEIRQPEECFQEINREEDMKVNKSIEIMTQFLHKFTQSFIVDSNELEKGQSLNSWQQIRFSNIFKEFYGFQESKANHYLYNQQELILDFCNFWDADMISHTNDTFNLQAVDLIKRENTQNNLMDSFYQIYKRKQQLVEYITSHAVTFINQFDSNPISIYYSPYGKWETDVTPLNEILHLQKKRLFKESKNRNPITKHILEAVKVIVKLKNNSLPTNMNNQNNTASLSNGVNSMTNAQMNIGQGVINMGIINSSINNPNINLNQNKSNQPLPIQNNIQNPNQPNNQVANQNNPQNIPNNNNNQNNRKGLANNANNNSQQQPIQQQIQNPNQILSNQMPPIQPPPIQGQQPMQQGVQQIAPPLPGQISNPNNIPGQFPQQQGIQQNGMIPLTNIPPPPPQPNSNIQQQAHLNPLTVKSGAIPTHPPPPPAKSGMGNQMKPPGFPIQPPSKPNQPFHSQDYSQTPDKVQGDVKIGNPNIAGGQMPLQHPHAPPQMQGINQIGGDIMNQQPQNHGGIPRNNSAQKQQMMNMNYIPQPPTGQSQMGGIGGQNQNMPRQFSGNMSTFQIGQAPPPPPPTQNQGIHGNQNNRMFNPQFQMNQQQPQQGSNQNYMKNNMNIPPINNQNQFGMNQHGQHFSRNVSGGNYYQQGQPIPPPTQGPSVGQQNQQSLPNNQSQQPPFQAPPPPPPPTQMMYKNNMGVPTPPISMRQGMQGQIHQQQPIINQQYPPQQQQLNPPQYQAVSQNQAQGSNRVNELLSLTSDEKKILTEKIEEIKQLQKNRNDPRSARKIQAIFAEFPKLAELIKKNTPQQQNN
ncbi:hypothetical protein TTHERM_00046740 (macronuclear) [Tetrahymena thermophila SB210]|uniref:Virilizer N-terminal domain-containing protein n=1 Tax=Tetrahymena thermophila (strain SB210) TaxID=312017 RepID=Q23DL7_TETTS|nr:hypothetical protein TTHERM_00046740 [Tetrahymena thermophila SB210]EAR94579.2 hypothetical protein TTHERM_00046740 [Tetrahymena thermophila SB210]|eukprot:XP_001014669.2 hypothetical protein TTHERM_00046740 [Tetrahymena thermophila SB210]